MIVRVRLERTHCTSSKRSSARSTMFRSGGSGPNRITCPNGPWLERFEPFPVAAPDRHKLLASDVVNQRKQDGFEQVPIANDSKALRIVPRWHLMLIARHGQALMFCDSDRSTSKAQSDARSQPTNRQETMLQTISYASEVQAANE